MSNINTFLKNKNKQYTFEIHAEDGIHKVTTTDLEQFSKDWFSGNGFSNYVTRDGRRVLPADEYTENATKKYDIINNKIESLYQSNHFKNILKESTGLELKELVELTEGISDKNYIETNKGRVFLIPENSELKTQLHIQNSITKESNLGDGSMTLQDTLIFKDKLNSFSVIVDFRNEAVELIDMVSRNIEKNKILHLREDYIDDINDTETHYFEASIFSDDKTLDNIVNTISNDIKFPNDLNGLDLNIKGFNNNENNPANYYSLSKVAEKHPIIQLTAEDTVFDIKKDFEWMCIDAIIVNEKLIKELGAKGKTAFIEAKGQGVIEICDGDILQVDATLNPLFYDFTILKSDSLIMLTLFNQ